MERRTDGQDHALLRPGFPQKRRCLLDARHRARDDDLPRAVEVDCLHSADLLRHLRTDLDDLLAIEPHDGRHAALTDRHSLLHEGAALMDEEDGVGEVEHAGGNES